MLNSAVAKSDLNVNVIIMYIKSHNCIIFHENHTILLTNGCRYNKNLRQEGKTSFIGSKRKNMKTSPVSPHLPPNTLLLRFCGSRRSPRSLIALSSEMMDSDILAIEFKFIFYLLRRIGRHILQIPFL